MKLFPQAMAKSKKGLEKLVTMGKEFSVAMAIKEIQKYHGRVQYPDELTETFADIIGMENEKEIFQDALNFLDNIEVYQQNPILSPHTRYLLGGAPGSGKTPLVNGMAKTANVPIITINMSVLVGYPRKIKSILNTVFDLAKTMKNGCVILFNSFPAVTNLSPELLMMFHNHFISKVVEAQNAIIVISTAYEAFALPAFYFEDKAFSQNKSISIQPPTLATRQKLLEYYFDKFEVPLAKDVSSEQLARNTLGMYPKDLEYIVRETKLHVVRKGGLLVSAKDFNDVMLKMEAGELYNKLSENERLSTAYHEAGHVVAAYYSDPDYRLGRVEITPRSLSLGLTLEDAGEEKNCLFKHEMEFNIIYSLGGMAAEKLIYGESTSGVSSDLRHANIAAVLMYQNLGMSDELGPVIFDDDEGLTSDKLWHESEIIIQKQLKRLYDLTLDIVKTYQPQLEALTKALMEREVLMGPEIQAIFDAVDATAGTPARATMAGLPKPPNGRK